MNVRSRRVSSKYPWRGRRSRKSEIYSSVEVGICVGTTRSGVVGLAAAFLTLAAALIFDFPAAVLVAAVDLGLGILGLAVFLVAVTLGSSGASVTG